MHTRFSDLVALQKVSNNKKLLDRALTDFHHSAPQSIIDGRNVTAGYARAWGLESELLSSFVAEDPVYRESIKITENPTAFLQQRLLNIFLIMKYGLTDFSGDFIEFGCHHGTSAIFMANVARRLGFTGTVYALDTFGGVPSSHDTLDFHATNDFKDASFDNFVDRLTTIGLTNLVPVKGLFEETAPALLQRAQKIILAHIDCDIYSAVNDAIEITLPHLHPAGGYLIFDDALQGSCLGALQAVEEMIQKYHLRAEQTYPHLVYRYPPVNVQLTG